GPVDHAPGFGLLARKDTSQAAVLISQSPGAFPSGACQEKRQRTAAVHDAVAPCHRSKRVLKPHACAMLKGALHVAHEGEGTEAFCTSEAALAIAILVQTAPRRFFQPANCVSLLGAPCYTRRHKSRRVRA